MKPIRHVVRAAAVAALVGLASDPVQAADYDLPTDSVFATHGGVACAFEDGAPTISLPWRSVWLGHFSGGRFTRTAYGNELDWKNEKLCFPSHGSCSRWVSANRRAFRHPEGYWTCLPIR